MLAEDTSRLIKIDELYALRLDRFVSLPQLVVVGDQSSGKSSVLEGLTGIPFPRDSGLCTRFPTQIVFKRSKNESVEISILRTTPDGQVTDPLSLLTGSNLEDFDEKEFLRILEKARQLMGIRDINTPGSSFSEDVLKIELSGPDHEHFSVIDLPGIFRKPTAGQTTKKDIALVRKMISSYIRNPRSIMLAVIPANVDIATQEIIQMAEDVDPQGVRTLGVMTKPDLVDKGAESRIVDLVNGCNGRMKLGYTIVCNRNQSNLDLPLDARNAHEVAFFESEPWNSIEKEKVGVRALKKRLDKLLVTVTRQNFKAVAADVQKGIQSCQSRLEDIGSARQTAEQQRTYLTKIASMFQAVATKAVDGYYARDQCFRDPKFRLATTIAELNEAFSEKMHTQGSSNFLNAGATHLSRSTPTSSSDIRTPDGTSESPLQATVAIQFPELSSIIRPPMDAVPKDECKDRDTLAWIAEEYNLYRGFEVGSVNPSLLPNLFSELSSPWEDFAFSHVEAAIAQLHLFARRVLSHVCPDPQVVQTLWQRLTPMLLQSYQSCLRHVEFLVSVEGSGKLITLNHYFADNLRKRRLDRIENRLKSLKSWVTNDDNKEPLLRLRDTLDAFVSNEDQTVQDMHDMLSSYYKVALKRFTDAICIQAVDHHLVSSASSPLWVLSPEYISMLADEDLRSIAGERPETREARRAIQEELSTLLAGQTVLQS